METLKAKDYDAYLNIWEGHCKTALAGAVYAKELRDAMTEGRICKVPYDQSQPVHTFWDLGWADCTSILFAQKIGFEYHLIDAYQSQLELLPHYLKVLQGKGYVYGTHYLPHDADNGTLGAPSTKKQMDGMGYKTHMLDRVARKKDGLDAVRSIFNRLYIDETKCADFLQNLRRYAYKIDERGQWSKEPDHNEHSHYADALQALGQSINAPNKRKENAPVEIRYQMGQENTAWLAT